MFEVDFLLSLAAYLVDQGHEPGAVTILTTYVGQQLLIQQVLYSK